MMVALRYIRVMQIVLLYRIAGSLLGVMGECILGLWV